MTDHPREGTVAAPGSPDFALHTLGWRAFQDLCAAVLREVWAQSIHTFADSNDGGRDGAFYGTWQQPPDPIGVQDVPDGPFVLQCKHTKKADTTLAPSDLDDEFAKVQALVDRGLCGSYVLLTNARVSGTSEATIRQRLLDAGVAYPLILDGQWICDTIATHQRLRTFVPRVYGLGDLSQILDERAYTQAQYLLSYLREELATFVVTDAYRRAAQAVQQHGFVLLLGEPAVGKSVIAATLAMTALDAWGCLTVNAHDAAELVRHWNPDEPNQFFWIDDAFGAVRHEPQLTDNWSRHMRQVMTAVHGGAKIVLTSRDYIYRDARPQLKEYAYPLLHEQQVVVDVAQLPLEERRQILYNHISLGDQPAEVRGKMKPHLEEAAAQNPFHPEVARRLGRQAFTRHLELSKNGVTDFMRRPTAFLRDLYTELGPDERAALALTYQAGEILPSPLTLDAAQQDVIVRLGSSPAGIDRALNALTGTFLRFSSSPGNETTTGWSFRHPTLQEGFAELLAANPNLLGVFLSGLQLEKMLTELDCGSDKQRGTLVKVPSTLYPFVAKRLQDLDPRHRKDHWEDFLWCNFFTTRCSDEFLKHYTETDPNFVSEMMNFGIYLGSDRKPEVLARLHQAELINTEQHEEIVQNLTEYAVSVPDSGWVDAPHWNIILSEEEREAIWEEVRSGLLSPTSTLLSDWSSNRWGNRDQTPEEYYAPLRESLEAYRDSLSHQPEIAEEFNRLLTEVDELIEEEKLEDDEEREAMQQPNVPPLNHILTTQPNPAATCHRSVFDDIDGY
ncbi:nSTAND3 domain-containing NTPase [Streptomyces pristinaespiralis]|uniref:nSTAND3 domain-containing NTPase n=1 Tax=Streptomyces pristinaespiralis TaxID=38300 RepID=UPI0038339BA0